MNNEASINATGHGLKEKKLFLLDMDGTIYLGDRLYDGTLDFLKKVRDMGARYLFVTNNSSKGVNAYIDKLASMGIAATDEDFLTSVNALITDLHNNGYDDSLIYAAGTRTFKDQLREEGFNITESLCDGIDLLINGFDTELTFQKLEDACKLLMKGVDWIATNPDWVCPTEFGSVPDCGSVCEMLTRATGRKPRFIGKPRPDMALLAVDKYGLKREDALMIGDRIYTDIACGVNAGVDTAFVLSGEGVMEDLERYDVHPTYIFKDIREIYLRL